MRRRVPITYYLLAAGWIVLVTFAESNIPIFKEGLMATPYLLLVVVTALLGDYIISVLAIVLSSVALLYVATPSGFTFTTEKSVELTEYLVAALVAAILSWRIRNLRSINLDLASTVQRLNDDIMLLQQHSSTDKKSLAKLKKLNKQLDELVNQFMKDDNYWGARLSGDASKTTHYKKYFQQ